MDFSTVLFDIGNVLTEDGHDTYLTHREYGLLRNSDIDTNEALTLTAPIFRKYAVNENTTENDFWRDINATLKTSFSMEEVATVKHRTRSINPEMIAVFNLLKQRSIKIGVISNSVVFLYKELADELSLSHYVDDPLYFLSHEQGVLKSNGLFEIAAIKLEPGKTLLIEDRPKNAAYARSIGFKVSEYSFESGASLYDLVSELINPDTANGRY